MAVGDVDVTSDEAEGVCSDAGVGRFPSLVFFTDETGTKGDLHLEDTSDDALSESVKDGLMKRECHPETGTYAEPTARRYCRKGSVDHGASKSHVDWLPRKSPNP